MRLVLQTADAAGVQTNCVYPNRVEVTSAQELQEAVKMDHVCGEYKDDYRSIANFIRTNVVVMDCDNDHSKNPDDWITPEKLDELMGDLSYTDRIRVWIKPEDRKRIKERMKEAGVKNMSAYIRKMAIDGYIVKLDLSDVREVSRLLRINSNNINQYAKRANETGSIYLEDVMYVKREQEKLWGLMKEILQRLSTI